MSASDIEVNLSQIAHDYLANLSPLAAKVNADIEDVISNYQDFWSSLKPKEKEKLIGESKVVGPFQGLGFLDLNFLRPF